MSQSLGTATQPSSDLCPQIQCPAGSLLPICLSGSRSPTGLSMILLHYLSRHVPFVPNCLNSVQLFLCSIPPGYSIPCTLYLLSYTWLLFGQSACWILPYVVNPGFDLVLFACPYQDFLICVTSSLWQWYMPYRGFSSHDDHSCFIQDRGLLALRFPLIASFIALGCWLLCPFTNCLYFLLWPAYYTSEICNDWKDVGVYHSHLALPCIML